MAERAFAKAHNAHAGERAADRRQCLQEDAVALLGLEPTDDDEDRVGLTEAQRLPHPGGRRVLWIEAAYVATVVNHDDLPRRQAFILDEVAPIGLGYRNVLIHEAAGDAVHDVARLQALAP